MNHPTDYTYAQAGTGKDGPPPDCWRPWKHSAKVSRQSCIELAAGKYLREAGFTKSGAGWTAHTFTVWHYREGDPLHPNGRPKRVHAVTFVVTPNTETATA